MQQTLEYDRGLSWRWLAALGWCLAGIATAAIVGAVIGWFESWFEFGFLKILLIYLFILAACCWFIVTFFMEKARVRFGSLALTVSMLIMLGFLAGYEVPGYFYLRQDLNTELHQRAQADQIDPKTVDFEGLINHIFLEKTGAPGYLGYLKLRMERTGLEFFIRIIVGAGIAIFAWRGFYIKPYCKECHDFYRGAKMVGGVWMKDFALVKSLFESGSFYAAGQMLKESISGYPKVFIYLQSCTNPRMHESVLIADSFFVQPGSNKIMTQHLMNVKINAAQWENLMNGIKAPRLESEKDTTFDVGSTSTAG